MHQKEIDIVEWARETSMDDERRFVFLKGALENKTVLDFGCGNGGFLLKARNLASYAAGVELEKRLQPYFEDLGIDVRPKLEDFKDSFDIITLFHVLEHLPDPIDMLKSLSKRIKRDGRIIIEVPNADDALLKLYENKAFSRFTYWSCHLFLFNIRTLFMLADRSGLKINFIKQIQRYPLSNHLYWLSRGLPGGHKKWNFIDSEPLHVAYEQQLAALGICDTIIADFTLP